SSHGERNCAKRACISAQRGSADIISIVRKLHVAVKALNEHVIDPLAQVRIVLDYASAHRDGSGGGSANDHMAHLGKRPCNRFPKRIVGRYFADAIRADTRLQ